MKALNQKQQDEKNHEAKDLRVARLKDYDTLLAELSLAQGADGYFVSIHRREAGVLQHYFLTRDFYPIDIVKCSAMATEFGVKEMEENASKYLKQPDDQI